MTTTFIYALCEPGTRTVRYIGKANAPHTRLKQHLRRASKTKTHLGFWLMSLAGKRPNLIILCETSIEAWQEEETRYIKAARAIGIRLTNGTDGGDGHVMRGKAHPMFGRKGPAHPAFGRRHTPEARARMGKSGPAHPMFGKTGDQNPMFGKSGKAAPMYGRAHTPESREKMQLATKGKQAGEKHRNFGKRLPRETRDRISKALTGRKFSVEHKAALSLAHMRKDP